MSIKKKILILGSLTFILATFLAIVFGFYLKLLAGLVVVGLIGYLPTKYALRQFKRKVFNKGSFTS